MKLPSIHKDDLHIYGLNATLYFFEFTSPEGKHQVVSVNEEYARNYVVNTDGAERDALTVVQVSLIDTATLELTPVDDWRRTRSSVSPVHTLPTAE